MNFVLHILTLVALVVVFVIKMDYNSNVIENLKASNVRLWDVIGVQNDTITKLNAFNAEVLKWQDAEDSRIDLLVNRGISPRIRVYNTYTDDQPGGGEYEVPKLQHALVPGGPMYDMNGDQMPGTKFYGEW